MAISLKTAGGWAPSSSTGFTADQVVTIPGTPAAGDRMFLFATWKPFSVSAVVSGWTEITEFADGSVANGAGVGSVKVGCWYRDWQSGDGNPTLDLDAAVSPGAAVINLWQKDGSETWDTPLFATAAHAPAATSLAEDASSGTTVVPNGSVVMNLLGICDDGTIVSHVITDSGAAITWAASTAGSPTTGWSATTGNDGSARSSHRLVTTGGTVTLRATATLAGADTGAILWVVQGVTAGGADPEGALLHGGKLVGGGLLKKGVLVG